MEKKEYEYLENMDENSEITEERKEELIKKATDEIRKGSIALSKIIKVCENEEETDFLVDFLIKDHVKIRGINVSLAGEYEKEEYKYIKRLKTSGEGQFEYSYYYKPLEEDEQQRLFNELKSIQGYALTNQTSREYKRYIDIRNKLVTHSQGLVNFVANRFSIRNKMLSIEELISAGNLGLINAVEKFDPTLGYKFSTYAVKAIYHNLIKECMSIDRRQYLKILQEQEIEDAYVMARQKSKKEPTLEELMDTTDYDKETLRRALEAINKRWLKEASNADAEFKEWSISENKRKDTEGEQESEEYTPEDESFFNTRWREEDTDIETLVNEEFIVEEEAESIELRKHLAKILKTLNPRQEEILKLRFGLNDGKTRTLAEIGEMYGISRDWVRQIEAKALRDLRHPKRANQIKDFLE